MSYSWLHIGTSGIQPPKKAHKRKQIDHSYQEFLPCNQSSNSIGLTYMLRFVDRWLIHTVSIVLASSFWVWKRKEKRSIPPLAHTPYLLLERSLFGVIPLVASVVAFLLDGSWALITFNHSITSTNKQTNKHETFVAYNMYGSSSPCQSTVVQWFSEWDSGRETNLTTPGATAATLATTTTTTTAQAERQRSQRRGQRTKDDDLERTRKLYALGDWFTGPGGRIRYDLVQSIVVHDVWNEIHNEQQHRRQLWR